MRLLELKALPLVKTDKGVFLLVNGSQLSKEFDMKGTVIKRRAGIVTLSIDGEEYAVNGRAKEGDVVSVVLELMDSSVDIPQFRVSHISRPK